MNRLITGLASAVIWCGLLYSQSYMLLWLFITAVAAVGLYEYFKICLPQFTFLVRLLFIFIGILPVISTVTGTSVLLLPAVFASLLLFIVFSFLITLPGDCKRHTFIHKTSLCILIISLCASHVGLMITLEDGVLWLGLLSVIIIGSDTGAYYTGSNFGKHKLCPGVSPGKTIEGFFGGVFCSVFFAWIYKILFLENQLTVKVIILSVALSIIGVCGDLTESVIKRAHNIKDSGTILPGHGGILDRIDSILAAAPALYYSVFLGFMY